MTGDGEQGRFKTEIPDEAIAAAVAAVEKHAPGAGQSEADAGPGTPGLEVVVEAGEGAASAASGPALEADLAERERVLAEERADELDAAAERERKLAEEVERLRAELADERGLRLRALADLDNFRKRVAREREQVQRFGAEALLRDVLPVLDNMDRALGALPEGSLATGVSMTLRQLEDVLKRHGLKPFAVEVGTVFDPLVHEAVGAQPTSEQPPGTVVSQAARGYHLHDRLLRPASVVVALEPSVGPEGDGPPAE